MASKNSKAAAQARTDRRQAERDARRSTGKAQPLNADRPSDRQQRNKRGWN